MLHVNLYHNWRSGFRGEVFLSYLNMLLLEIGN